MTSKELYTQIVELAEAFKEDGLNFQEKGNKAAAMRARKATQEMEKLGKAYRKASVQEAK